MTLINSVEILSAFEQCGVSVGDTVFLHCDAIFLAQIAGCSTLEKVNLFFDVLEGLLGEQGTLILPVFTYSFTKGENFNIDQTPSTVGMLTEYFRKRKGVKRSKDPNFSIACTGRYLDEFINAPIHDTFGVDSTFGLLYRLNAHIICLGCSMDRITFTHFVEEQLQVSYRYFKKFNGTIVEQQRTYFETINYFVRDNSIDTKTNLALLKKALEESELIKKSTIGRASLLSVSARDFFQQAKKLLKENKYGLIGEGH